MEIMDVLLEVSATQKLHSRELEKLSDKLERQHETLLRNTITVEEHHKRSNQLEAEFSRINAEVIKLTAINELPIPQSSSSFAKTVRYFRGISYILGGLSSLGGILWGMFHLAKRLGL